MKETTATNCIMNGLMWQDGGGVLIPMTVLLFPAPFLSAVA